MGESFGDIALINKDCTRTATIRAYEDAFVATLTKQDYTETLKLIVDRKEDAFIKWLRSTLFFSRWSRSMLIKFNQTLTEVPTQKGRVLMTENQVNKYFYIILEGQFEILKQVRKPVSNEDLSDTQI